MSTAGSPACATCYGAGEVITEQGPTTCRDCLGHGSQAGRLQLVEWRLREMERALAAPPGGPAGVTSGALERGDAAWLIAELRRTREALVQILSRCQDADAGDTTAQEIMFVANEALGLYMPTG